ncbi:MAG: hypothetical protein PVSMB4_10980 [Ktedonobacterales bacterium]
MVVGIVGAAMVGIIGAHATNGAPVARAAAGGGPPQAATANVTALIGPSGGSIEGFGITATFAPGAVADEKLIILGNWPNGLDVAPPNGEVAVKTFSLQQCNADGTYCTSAFGDYPNSPAGSERINGQTYDYTGFQGAPGAAVGVTWLNPATTPATKLVTITIATGGDKIYIYNPNFSDTARAYPVLLPSSSNGSSLTFQTFRPIVWTVTTPPTSGN